MTYSDMTSVEEIYFYFLKQMNERFQFLRSYAEVINKVASADKELAKELSRKIINYGIYWIDEDSGNAILEGLFVQIKIMIDKGNDITEKRRNANKQRTNVQQNLTKVEQNLTNDEQTDAKKKIENGKDKKEKELDNNLTVITEAKASEYGNPEVNLCLSLIKKYNWGLVDWTVNNQRRYCKLLIDKLKKLESIQQWKYTWEDTLEIILKVISQNKFYCGKITSPENIYRNLSLLMQQCKNDVGKASENTVLQAV